MCEFPSDTFSPAPLPTNSSSPRIPGTSPPAGSPWTISATCLRAARISSATPSTHVLSPVGIPAPTSRLPSPVTITP